jgi:hypothetical protein
MRALMITDHVFRVCQLAETRARTDAARRRSDKVDPGMCCYLTTCNRPQDDHITHIDFRDQRRP